jgi:hypothetical protein
MKSAYATLATGLLSPNQVKQTFLLGAIKASSQEQYASNKNRVIKAGHRWDHDGLYDYFTDEKVATKLWLLLNS